MADYYTEFCFLFELEDHNEKAWFESLVSETAEREQQEALDGTQATLVIPEGLYKYSSDSNYLPSFELSLLPASAVPTPMGTPKPVDGYVSIGTEESGDPAEVIDLLQDFLGAFPDRKKNKLGFTWADTCSKNRTDAFSGGAVVVSAGEYKTMYASDWLETQLKKLDFSCLDCDAEFATTEEVNAHINADHTVNYGGTVLL